MLYDPKWNAKPKTAEPLSIEGLIAWLEKQPANTHYNWHDCFGECLIGRYAIAHGKTGIHEISDFMNAWVSGDRLPHYIPIGLTRPWTYGAALERARAALRACALAHTPSSECPST